jgi:hypothetical protein
MNADEIAKTIVSLKKSDLQLRNDLINKGKLFDGYNREMEKLHNINAMILNNVIDQIGYPTIDKVGNEASEAAWLVIQHSISQPAFMRMCRDLLENAVCEKKADPIHLAYLTDRIAVYEGKPQLYGTQFDWDENGELSPRLYDDLIKLNQRRESIGLNRLEDQTEIIRRQAQEENQSPPKDVEKRKRDIEEWKYKVGWIK